MGDLGGKKRKSDPVIKLILEGSLKQTSERKERRRGRKVLQKKSQGRGTPFKKPSLLQ